MVRFERGAHGDEDNFDGAGGEEEGGGPCVPLHTSTICPIELKMDFLGHLLMYLPENFSTFA